MSLSRKFLKARELEPDLIDEIIERHAEAIDALKAERDEYKARAEKLEIVQKELDKLKAEMQNDDPYKAKYEKEHSDFEAFKKEIASKNLVEKKSEAYKELLKAANIDAKHFDSILNVTKFDDLELDEDGKIKDADKAVESIKDKYSSFIFKEGTIGAGTETPPANIGGKTLTKADIYRRDEHGRYVLSSAERQKALLENNQK